MGQGKGDKVTNQHDFYAKCHVSKLKASFFFPYPFSDDLADCKEWGGVKNIKVFSLRL